MVRVRPGRLPAKSAVAPNSPSARARARGGVVVFAIDFRNPPEATYPASVADMNFAVRWLKANATRFNTRPNWIGTMGTSSGGHLAVLVAMKPHDARYASIPFAAAPKLDASVPFVVSMWPVICPATRVQENKDRQARGDREADAEGHEGEVAHSGSPSASLHLPRNR